MIEREIHPSMCVPAAFSVLFFFERSPREIMDRMESEDMGGGGCEEKNCGPASAFLEDCSSQDCDWDQPVFGFTELGLYFAFVAVGKKKKKDIYIGVYLYFFVIMK